MKIECVTVGMFQVNTYVVTDEASGASVVIDTGEGPELADYLANHDPPLDVKAILLTHGHTDHAGSLVDLQRAFPHAPTYLPRLERPLFDALPKQGNWFGMPALNRPCGRIEHEVEDGDVLTFGGLTFRFISTPGHTPGQGCYVIGDDVFVGDTLFSGSIGRTDFPMSDRDVMKDSLRRLLEEPGHLRVHSGHGPVTTLAEELEDNPFLGYLRNERGMARGMAIDW